MLDQILRLDPHGRYRLALAGVVALAVFAAYQLGYCTGEECLGGQLLAGLLASLGLVRPTPPPADDIPFGLLVLAGLTLLLAAPAAEAGPLRDLLGRARDRVQERRADRGARACDCRPCSTAPAAVAPTPSPAAAVVMPATPAAGTFRRLAPLGGNCPGGACPLQR